MTKTNQEARDNEREALKAILWEWLGPIEADGDEMGAFADAILAAGYRKHPEPEITAQALHDAESIDLHGMTDAQWHIEAMNDTGVDHALHPRQYVITCEWCDAVFWGARKADAMRKLDHHREETYGRYVDEGVAAGDFPRPARVPVGEGEKG